MWKYQPELPMKHEILFFQNLKIQSSGKTIFENLFLQVYTREVFSVLFDNSEEKKYFIDFIRGKYTLTAGNLYLYGEPVTRDKFSRFIFQQSSVLCTDNEILGNLSAADNLLINAHGFITASGKIKIVHDLLEKFKISISADKHASELSKSERILLQLLRAYYEKKKLILLDNKFWELNMREKDAIAKCMDTLVTEGIAIGIINTLDDIELGNASALFYIRNKITAGNFRQEITDLHKIRKDLLSAAQKTALQNVIPPRNTLYRSKQEEKRLVVHNICSETFSNIHFSVGKGEIKKIFFADSDELYTFLDIFTGKSELTGGTIGLQGKTFVPVSCTQMIKSGIGIIKNMNYTFDIFDNMTVRDTIGMLLSLKKKNFWFFSKYRNSVIGLLEKYMRKRIACNKGCELSDREKICISYIKWIAYNPKVIFIINPFTEQDFEMQNRIRNFITTLKNNNTAVILLFTHLQDTQKIEGETVFIAKGMMQKNGMEPHPCE